MKVGDLVKLIDTFVTVDFINVPEVKIAMIIEGPNDVGNIKVLLTNGKAKWVHCSDVQYFPRNDRNYLKE